MACRLASGKLSAKTEGEGNGIVHSVFVSCKQASVGSNVLLRAENSRDTWAFPLIQIHTATKQGMC